MTSFPSREDPVDVSSPNEETWRVLGSLERRFPGGWVLIGGLMVYLLGAEAVPFMASRRLADAR